MEAQIAFLIERVQSIEEEISKALNTLSQGVARNMDQMWENQRELVEALSEVSSCIPVGEVSDEKRESPRP